MKKILITGALGHIGSKLLDMLELINKDTNLYKIDIVDCNLNKIDIKKYFDRFNYIQFSYIDSDLRNCNLKTLVTGYDIVIHLAGTVNAIETVNNEYETMENNFIVPVKLYSACIDSMTVKKFIFMSTASVYGPGPASSYLFERKLNPQTPYARHKMNADLTIQALWKDRPNVDIHILRSGTVFGMSYGVRYHTAINKFVYNAVNNKPITIWSPGKGLRPYIYIDDIAQTIIDCFHNEGRESSVIDVVGTHWSPLDIINIIKEVIPLVEIEMVTPRIINQDSYIIHGPSIANYKTKLLDYINQVITA